MLQVIDDQWKDHLLSMDHLKEGIGLRGYGQKDPLVEYKKESFILFQDMMDRIEDETVRYLFFLKPVEGETAPMAFAAEGELADGNGEMPPPPANGQQRAAAQSTLEDFTRNIQRKKEKELAELQFVGGDSSASKPQTVVNRDPRSAATIRAPAAVEKSTRNAAGQTGSAEIWEINLCGADARGEPPDPVLGVRCAGALMSIALFAALAVAAPPAALLRGQFAGFSKSATETPALSDKSLWDEYGLLQTEQAEYVSGNKRCDLTAWRFKDSTGAYGAFEWQRPANSWQSKTAALAAETKDEMVVAAGIICSGLAAGNLRRPIWPRC